MEWTQLETLLTAEDGAEPEALVEALLALDDKRRRALAKPLTAFVKQRWHDLEDLRSGSVHAGTSARRRQRLRTLVANLEAVRLAVVGVSGAASAAATWLLREQRTGSTAWRGDPRVIDRRVARLNRVLATRPGDWSARVLTTVAAKMEFPGVDAWCDFVFAKLGEYRLTPPATQRFTSTWLYRYSTFRDESYEQRLAVLRADPLLPHMLDAVFGFDDLGWHLESGMWSGTTGSGHAVPNLLKSLVEHGDIDRGQLIDGCLRRLLRGGKVGDLRPYRLLLEDLAVTPAETAERVRALVALLPDAVSTTATVAQRLLRSADAAGLLAGETVAEASEAILFRTEKKLVREQLSWLDDAIDRHPEAADELLTAVGAAFGHTAAEIGTRAVTLLLGHAAALSPQTRATLAGAATTLPTGDRDRLAELLDLATEAPEANPAPVSPPVRPASEAITSIPELAERIAALDGMSKRDPRGQGLDCARLEPILASLVTFAHDDRAGLTAALKPVADGFDYVSPQWYNGFGGADMYAGVRHIVLRAIGVADRTELDAESLYRADIAQPEPTRPVQYWHRGLHRMDGPQRVLAHRLVEIAVHIATAPVPRLLAAEVDAIGRLDPDRLVERLRRAESEHWQPWEFDLQQALLRLPETVGPETIAAASTLTGAAGRRLAEWLSGRDRPEITVTDQAMVMNDPHADTGELEIALPLSTVSVRQPDRIRRSGIVQLSDQLPLSYPEWIVESDLSFDDPDVPRTYGAVLPSRPDVVAAHFVRHLGPTAFWELYQSMPERHYLSALPDLAESDGPVDTTVNVCLAFGLNSGWADDRANVVEALTVLAARDRLDAVGLARRIAELIGSGLGKCTRTATGLAEFADAGGTRQVWEILAAVLPRLLTAAKAPHRLADLVELAARTADSLGVRGEIEAVATVAAQRGSSKLVKEAKRLHTCLTR